MTKKIPIKKLIRDIQKTCQKTEEKPLKKKTYRKKGEYSPETVVRRFGSWEKALKSANMPTKKHDKNEIIKDIKQTNEKTDGYLSIKKYLEKSEISQYHITQQFGSWNKAKQEAGLEAKKKDADKEEILQDIKKVAQQLEQEQLSKKTYLQKGKYPRLVDSQLDNFSKACKKADVIPKKNHRTDKELEKMLKQIQKEIDTRIKSRHLRKRNLNLQVVTNRYGSMENMRQELGLKTKEEEFMECAEHIEDLKLEGYYHTEDIKDIASEIGVDIQSVGQGISQFVQYLDQHTEYEQVKLTTSGGNGSRVYFYNGKYNSKNTFKASMREKYDKLLNEADVEDPEKFELFIEYIGKGCTPTGIMSGIFYCMTDLTQREVAKVFDTTEVTVRNNYRKVKEDIAEDSRSIEVSVQRGVA